MEFIEGLHSGLRWILLLVLILAIVNAYSRWKAGKKYGPKDKLINLLTLIITHIQVTIGFILYFGNKRYEGFSHMDIDWARFLAIEHMLGMLIAAVLITLGRKRAEKSEKPARKHRKIFVWFLIALVIILVSIPWPFRPGFESFGWF